MSVSRTNTNGDTADAESHSVQWHDPKCGVTLNDTLRAGEEELSGTMDQRGVVNEW